VRPVESAFLVNIIKPKQQEEHEQQHLEETAPFHILEIDGPGIEKYDLHIEENKENGDEEIAYGKGKACVPFDLYTTFEVLVFMQGAYPFALAGDKMSGQHSGGYKSESHNKLY
jgi:hypothetical protein